MHQVLTHEIMAQIKIRHRHRRDPPPESYKFLKRLDTDHLIGLLLNGFLYPFIFAAAPWSTSNY